MYIPLHYLHRFIVLFSLCFSLENLWMFSLLCTYLVYNNTLYKLNNNLYVFIYLYRNIYKYKCDKYYIHTHRYIYI